MKMKVLLLSIVGIVGTHVDATSVFLSNRPLQQQRQSRHPQQQSQVSVASSQLSPILAQRRFLQNDTMLPNPDPVSPKRFCDFREVTNILTFDNCTCEDRMFSLALLLVLKRGRFDFHIIFHVCQIMI